MCGRIRIFCNGQEVTGFEEEKKAVAVECWYDPHYRHWVIYPVDAEGNQLCEARYGFGKKEAQEIKGELEKRIADGEVFSY